MMDDSLSSGGSVESVQQLGEEVKALKAELDTKQGNISPDTLPALLQAANQRIEEESEIMMDYLKSLKDIFELK